MSIMVNATRPNVSRLTPVSGNASTWSVAVHELLEIVISFDESTADTAAAFTTAAPALALTRVTR